ncbi:hypothetical protein KI387_003737, partial [Taxus chinensis]
KYRHTKQIESRRWRNTAQKHVKGADEPDIKDMSEGLENPMQSKSGLGGGETRCRSVSEERMNPTSKTCRKGWKTQRKANRVSEAEKH